MRRITRPVLSFKRRGSAVYLRIRSVEEEACRTQEILARHAGKTLRRTEERKRRRRRWERKEDGRERRTGTG